MSHYRDACDHVARRVSDEGVRVEADLLADANKGEDEDSHFLRGLVFSIKDYLGKLFGHARISVIERSSMVV